ncbi:NAD(P)/FAD-dependent oxidoreductase [Lapidilactobacillus luobeiensis]|uniref:NAD(P)/FAD-dependent oxidoreductase n=1 Tax=Lapidilactobacillus luobeiensis TaxID=2950371 RepID=UPI002852CEE4|nr:NAD(P)/FAD-dependent oxidoreductase [Lapidilactobacillus luobeiensis]
MMADYQTIIIGAGPAGNALAYRLASTQKVLVVENDLFGGTCPNQGCDAKKMLYSGIEVRQQAQRLQGHGLASAPKINWPDLMAFKRSYTEQVPTATEAELRNVGVTTVHGTAKFIAADILEVDHHQYHGNHIVIATGQRPHQLQIPGAELLKTSRDFLDLDQLPQRIIFIGGGYISFELANIAATAGAQVTLIHHNQRPLKQFPQMLVASLIQQMTAAGIQVHLGAEPQAVQKTATGLQLQTSAGDFDADLIINATGRQPNIDALGLDQVGINADVHGVAVNDHLQTSLPEVYAIGDVVKRTLPKLTPVASFEGDYLADQLLGLRDDAIDYPLIPTIVFGTEKLAQIGVSVNEAQKDTLHFQVTEMDVGSWYTYNRIQDKNAKVLLVKDMVGQVVGVSVLSALADELINHFADRLAQGHAPLYLYPTTASDLAYLN